MTMHFLTVPEIATRLRLSRMTVYRMVRDGVIASVRVGNSIRIPADSFESYLREQLKEKK